MTITNALQMLTSKELVRLQNSTKEFFQFEFNVFNAGVMYKFKCTNMPKMFGRNWNGYDFSVVNDATTQYYIAETIKSKLISNIVK
jgi:hypothetical protein